MAKATARARAAQPITSIPKIKSKQDEAIIGTNDYSIVSKRSVEKLYLRHEPEFLRPFVGKFKRRAPLINRGYWLRMKAIENTIKAFLDEQSSKQKVVVNLGCGFEPLPFRMLWKYSHLCHNVKFVDIDFPQLITKKVDMVKRDAILLDRLDDIKSFDNSNSSVHFSSDKYYAIGCDLGDHSSLKNILHDDLQLNKHAVLFIGEVSVVYMPPLEAADLIRTCSTFPDARFCLLEQHLPVGKDHAFARTMLEHFNKQTPLRGLSACQTIDAQIERMVSSGWIDVHVQDLWSLWQDDNFLSSKERLQLDSVEPFDEWEGLALFAGHYLLLIATSNRASNFKPPWTVQPSTAPEIVHQSPNCGRRLEVDTASLPRGYGRESGTIMKLNEDKFAFCGGTVQNSRQGNMDLFSSNGKYSPLGPLDSLSWQTITPFGGNSSVRVGGRLSPIRVNPQCWQRNGAQWTRISDLEPGRYRHSAVPVVVGGEPGVLVFGGKTANGKVLSTWCLYIANEWKQLQPIGDAPPSLFGTAMAAITQDSGLLMGGLGQSGSLSDSVHGPGFWRWKLGSSSDGALRIDICYSPAKSSDMDVAKSINRFGASIISIDDGAILVGGIGPLGPLQLNQEVILVKENGDVTSYSWPDVRDTPPPMLVGHSVTKTSQTDLIIVGGGIVCFSFGAFWNDKLYGLRFDETSSHVKEWQLISDVQVPEKESQAPVVGQAESIDNNRKLAFTPVPRCLDRVQIIGAIKPSTKFPTVLERLNLGTCIERWDIEYLMDKVGPQKPTVIHAASSPTMSFRDKNFAYETVSFGDFLTAAAAGSHVYMRALSTTQPSKTPAKLDVDFPELAKDFTIPNELAFVEDLLHSSVLRITGNVNMWLHYDVMANILCQIKGSKRVILFPPSDISRLDFPHGETTSNIDIFVASSQSLAQCSPIETILDEGDILFIPACWPHTTAPAGDNLSVATNIFFRSFDPKLYAAGRDVYGNRDLEMYQNGRKTIERITAAVNAIPSTEARQRLVVLAESIRARKSIADDGVGAKEANRIVSSAANVPLDIATFYLARLADEMVDLAKDIN